MPVDPSPSSIVPSPAQESPHAPLRRQLRLRDLVLTQVLCVVGTSWVGVAASLGRAQAVTRMAAMLVFYLPMAASVICLNRAMPLEGGLYIWARRGFGDLVFQPSDRSLPQAWRGRELFESVRRFVARAQAKLGGSPLRSEGQPEQQERTAKTPE